MSETLQFIIAEKEIDENNDIFDLREYNFSIIYTESVKSKISIASGTTYTTIDFTQIPTAKMVRINTDQSLNIKINSGTEIFVVNQDWICCGTFTALGINNASGTSATVTYEIYG